MQHTTQTGLSLLLLSFSTLLQAEVVEKSESAETVLSPITVTATRTEKETSLVSTTTIKRADIERLQVNSVEEALRGIAGVNIANNGGMGKTTSIFMRGSNSDHVLVLIDGVRVGSVTLGTTPFENIPINEIDSIEVVRGPKSSLYGSEALGGIIHIHTRSGANKKFKPVLSVSAGSHDHYRYSAGASGTIEDSWYNLNVTHEQTQGFNSCDSGLSSGCYAIEPDHDGYNNHSGSVRVGHKFSDRVLVEGQALITNGYNEYDGSIYSGNQSNFNQQVFGGQVKLKATDFWNFTFKAGDSIDQSKSKYNGEFLDYFNTERFSLSAQNDFTLAENHLLSVGYDFLSDNVKSSQKYAESQRNNHAGFAQYQGQLDEHQLNLGVRFDHNQQFGDHTTWNAAYGYHFLDAFNITASYATAYKAPTFNQLYYPNFGSPDLMPERSKNYEVGINGKHDWGQWAVNFYQNDIKDLIIFDPNNNYLPSNISAARIRGMDATASTQVFGFNVQGNLSLLSPENRGDKGTAANAGKILPRRAQQIFRLDVDRRFDDFSAGASFRAEGRRFDDPANTQRIGGFATLDLRAEYTLLKQLTLQAKVNNILNKQYQTVKGYNTDDLNVFFTLRYTPDI
jgi:vitamin B12 transporter